ETARISIQVPNKGEDAISEGDATCDLVSPAKKKRVTRGYYWALSPSRWEYPEPHCWGRCHGPRTH
ncbi:hypothetical protein A2U01_0091840, partial [Trifolium medium]|nr:hypothetical protein [Trifolium medium]